MSLDFYLKTDNVKIFEKNITHNLGKMAREVGIYTLLWHPSDLEFSTARQCIPMLSNGLLELVRNRRKYEIFNAPNGWGTYEHFVLFVMAVLTACCDYPDASVEVSI